MIERLLRLSKSFYLFSLITFFAFNLVDDSKFRSSKAVNKAKRTMCPTTTRSRKYKVAIVPFALLDS